MIMPDRVLGIDGCSKGWIAAVIDCGKLRLIQFHETVREALDEYAPGVCAIDIPIHLSDTGKRKADTEARKRVSRSSSVFPAPCRLAVTLGRMDSLEHLNQKLKEGRCETVNQQTRNLIPKIQEVQQLEAPPRVVEVHPEVSFDEMARQHGRTICHGKKTWNGLMERRLLLDAHGLRIPDSVATQRGTSDDVVDAVACGWSALRMAERSACSLGSEDEGQIWY